MLDDFLHRFKTLVDALMSHPRVRVTHLWIGPPATDEALATLTEAWGRELPAQLAVLYRQADGMQLRWVDVGDEMYDPKRDDPIHFDGPWRRLFEEPGVEAGLLNVPPIAELLSRDSVGAMGDYDEYGDEYAYLDRAVPFDSFGESQDAVIFFGDDGDDPAISVASDYLADVDPPGTLTLSAYLEQVLATWASTERRGTGPRVLDDLIRDRIELDPAGLVGQRVAYIDGCRGGSLMRGRVLSLTTLEHPPRSWWHGPTLAEIGDDLGETVYVPSRALYPPDDADDYERLHADPAALRALLRGRAGPMFAALASVSRMTYRVGLPDGPCICGHAWAHAALSARTPPAEAVADLLCAAQTLLEHPEVHASRPITWPKTRPPIAARETMSYGTLAVGLFDAAVLHVGRARPAQLRTWLDWKTTARLDRLLKLVQARDPLRGYDPLRDPSTTYGFMYRALRGGPTALETGARSPHRGGHLGLADLRVVGA